MDIYYVTVYCFSLDCNKDLLGGIRRDNYVYVDIAGAFLNEREKKGSTLTGRLGTLWNYPEYSQISHWTPL